MTKFTVDVSARETTDRYEVGQVVLSTLWIEKEQKWVIVKPELNGAEKKEIQDLLRLLLAELSTKKTLQPENQ